MIYFLGIPYSTSWFYHWSSTSWLQPPLTHLALWPYSIHGFACRIVHLEIASHSFEIMLSCSNVSPHDYRYCEVILAWIHMVTNSAKRSYFHRQPVDIGWDTSPPRSGLAMSVDSDSSCTSSSSGEGKARVQWPLVVKGFGCLSASPTRRFSLKALLG